MQSIVFFNNKGGVGKTTLLCNLASFLQIKKNKKVIIIDADPQCNSTIYMFPLDQLEKIYKDGTTINQIIEPLKKGKGYIEGEIPVIKSPNFEIDVIPGDTRLSLSEDFLSKDWLDAKSGDYRGLQTTFVFKDLINKLEQMGYDYAFFDVGPSLGALNRSVLVANDYYIVPMASDIFSIQALENISKALQEWQRHIKRGLSDYCERGDEKFEIEGIEVSWQLQFAGYITHQYKAKTVDGKQQPVKAYEKIIRQIPKAIERNLVSKTLKALSTNKLGEITNLNSLIPLSQNANVPIFNLKSEHGVVGAHFNKVREFEQIIGEISSNLLINIGDKN